MSLQATPDDKQTGEKRAMNGSGNKSGEPPAKVQKEEMQEPSTAVIQMTIQPQSASTESLTTEPLGVALAEFPLALLDIAPIEEAQVEPAESATAFEYVAEMEAPRVPVSVSAPPPPPPLPPPTPPPPPRPAFSYRSEAALMHHYPTTGHSAHSVHTYDYTDEGEFALERALAAIGRASAAGASAPPPAAPPAPLDEPPALDPAALYHELERGFNLERFEGVQLQSDPPSVEYSDNGAILQSELFELGQGGFAAQELPVAEEAAAEEFGLEAPPAPLAPAPSAAVPPSPESPASPAAPELPPPAPEDSPSPDDQPGPSRPRAHAVQLYPGGGEGEPHTCYITNLPRLAIEATFFEEGSMRGESMPLQARPLPSGSQSEEMLRRLLGAPGDEEGEVPSSPVASQHTSEDSSEPDKENKPDTIAVALRSAAISFASFDTDDSQTTENAAALMESEAAPDASLSPGDDGEVNEPVPEDVAQAEDRNNEASSLSEERKAISTGNEEIQSEEIQSSGLVDSPTDETDSNSNGDTPSEEEGLKLGSEKDNAGSPTGDQETATLSEEMGQLSVSDVLDKEREPNTLADTQTIETQSVAVPVEDKEKVSTTDENVAAEGIASIKESGHTSEATITAVEEEAVEAVVPAEGHGQDSEALAKINTHTSESTITTTVDALASSKEEEPAPVVSTQAGDSVTQVEVEEPNQLVTASDGHVPAAVDTDVATVDTAATNVLKIMGSPKKPKRKLAAARTAQVKSKKAKNVLSGSNKKPVASGSSTAAAGAPRQLKLKKRKGSATQAAPLKTSLTEQGQSTSGSTVSSEDSNDSKTLAAIIAERNAAAAAAAVAVEGPTSAAAAGDDVASEDNTAAAAEDTTAAAAAGAAADAHADAAAAPAASAVVPAQQSGLSKNAKGKRAASAHHAKTSKKQGKKARPAEVPTTTMVLRSRSHHI